MKKIILSESSDFISILKIFFLKRKNVKIYFSKSYQLHDNNFRKIKYFNDSQIFLSENEEEELTFKSNKIALDFILNIDTENNPYMFFIKKLVNSNHIHFGIKKYLLDTISLKFRYYLIYIDLKKKYPDHKMILIETAYDYFGIKQSLNLKIKDKISIKIFDKFKSLLFTTIYLPYHFINKLIKNGISFKYPEQKKYSIGQHLVNGFPEKYFENKFQNSRSDSLLFDNLSIKNRKNFVFIKSSWKFSKKEDANIRSFLNDHNIDLIDEINNKINIRYLFNRILINYLKIIYLNIKLVFSPNNNYFYNEILNKIIKNIFEFEIFNHYYNLKIFFARDEYNASHIIRTICLNKYGTLQYGFMHSAFLHPYKATNLTFIYFNKYFIPGKNYYEKIFKNYWFSNEHPVVGQPYLDFIFKATNDNNIKNKFFNYFGKNKINILIAVPTVNISSPFENINRIIEKYSNFSEILSLKSNINLIFRCRSFNDNIKLKKILINPIYKKNKNIYYITNEFSTYELASFSDIIIGNDTSSFLLEMIGFKNKLVIPYNVRFKNTDHLIWKQYKYKYLCNDINDIKKNILEFLNNKIEVHNNKIKDEIINSYSYPFDGKSWSRVSANIDIDLNK